MSDAKVAGREDIMGKEGLGEINVTWRKVK